MLPMSPAPPPAYQAFPDDEPSVRRDPRPPRFPRSVSDHARPLPLHHGNATGRASLPIIDNTADHPLPHAELRHTFAMGQVPSLPRALSLFLRGCVADEATRCHICFDDVAVGDTVTLSTCNHRFCARCLKPYLELKITEGNVYPVCFHPIDSGDNPRQQRACGQAISTEQIQEIVNAESFQKLKRFRLHKENDRARECPYCAHVQVYPGPEATVCACVQCAKTFCFLHGNAHAIGSCADYELRNAKVEAINRAKIQEISKPCPGCGRHVEKNGGCNHMRCIVCETHFCWLCMKEIDGNVAALHYDESTGGPCVGRHFESTRTLFRQEPLSMRIYVVLVMITCGPIAGLLGLIVTPFVWLFKRRDTFATAFVSVATFLTVVLQVPLMIPYFALVWIPESLVEAVMLLYRWVTRQRDAGEQAAAPQQNDLEVDLAIVVAR